MVVIYTEDLRSHAQGGYMRNTLGIAIAALALSATVAMPTDPPGWAYVFPPGPPAAPAAAPATPPPPDTSIKSVPGSTAQFTRQQIANRNGPADWFPGDHPAMPDVVAHGKAP